MVSDLHFQLFSGHFLMDVLQVSQNHLSRIECETHSHPDTQFQLPHFWVCVNRINHSVSQMRNLGAILPLSPPQFSLLSRSHTPGQPPNPFCSSQKCLSNPVFPLYSKSCCLTLGQSIAFNFPNVLLVAFSAIRLTY